MEIKGWHWSWTNGSKLKMDICGLAMKQSFLTDNVVLAWSRILIWLAEEGKRCSLPILQMAERAQKHPSGPVCSIPACLQQGQGLWAGWPAKESSKKNWKENQLAHEFLAEISYCLECHSHCSFIDSAFSVPINLFKMKWTSKCSVRHMYL